jgi:glutamine---fructose-6-phosphate transaminase (isomerizing)
MCGIFGLVLREGDGLGADFAERSLATLALLSESRGKDSSGFAYRSEEARSISVLRAPLQISALLKRREFTSDIRAYLVDAEHGRAGELGKVITVIGHSRLVTNGTQLNDLNNQPVVKDGLVGVHNGIIVNVDALWDLLPPGSREYDIDTEVLFALFRFHDRSGGSTISSISKALGQVVGTVSTGFLVDDRSELVVATNNGSLYVMGDGERVFCFASERHTLEQLKARSAAYPRIVGLEVRHVRPNYGCLLNLDSMACREFSTHEPNAGSPPVRRVEPYVIATKSVMANPRDKSLLVDFRDIAANPKASFERRLLEDNGDRVSRLRRCTRCILPETFPFISYDEQGVCNYCRSYRLKNQPRPLDDLRRLVEPYRSKNGSYDCIVPYSGGRDSTFTLHMMKTVLGMNPVAFTYDWGMVTDLARRNIARVCGKLGVENIIVAADIVKKRRNIQKNILAWLKRPSLGMIPLFMSGDKYFFYYTNRLKKQTGIRLNVWGINPLENTDFKTGFAGVPPTFEKKRIYSLSVLGQLKFFSFVGRNFLLNPSYLNSSNVDSVGSILSRYLYPQQDYYSMFDYYPWDEREIEDTIFSEYDWERAIDTRSTWRIGDGTASFYNYIYYTVAGFSENDTFRSNQIREGLLSREEALERLQEENLPRYDNMKWYLEIVGVDFETAVRTINAIPKLYA